MKTNKQQYAMIGFVAGFLLTFMSCQAAVEGNQTVINLFTGAFIGLIGAIVGAVVAPKD